MARIIRGHLAGPGADREHVVRINRVGEVDADTGRTAVPVGSGGQFEVAVPDDVSGDLELEVLDDRGRLALRTPLADGTAEGHLVVLVPEASADPRDVVESVAERLSAEREARRTATRVLASELDAEAARRRSVREAARLVVEDVSRSSGHQGSFFAADHRDIGRLVTAAVREGRSRFAQTPARLRTYSGAVTDGEVLPTSELVERLGGRGVGTEGHFRAHPLTARELRRRHQGPDGLPVPRSSGADVPEPTSDSASPSGDAAASIDDKVDSLVQAMRLPEDPPLLTADTALSASGAELALRQGVADVTAFHDFHQLVLAMPDVWQEAFDQYVVDLVTRGLDALSAAGDDLRAFAATSDGVRPADRLLDRLDDLAAVYTSTSASAIAPHTASSAVAPTDIVAGLSGGNVMARRRDDDLSGLGQPRPPGGGPIVDVPDDQEVYDPSIGESVPGLLRELRNALRGPHSFTVFAADGTERAINFAVLLTWRQLWDPLTYQTGEIAHTMTLAPGERRKIKTTRRRTLKRFTTEAERSQRSRTTESTDTTRAEVEILRKAAATTNFELTSGGSTKLLVADGSFTSTASRDVNRQGDETRRRFREAVLKAAQEYREEHSLEVKTESEDVFEEETTAEVQNPNDELAMTAVFYTLQRRYAVKERLYRARPVVLVAMPVPDPGEITTGWLVRYAWILRRSLLDDRFARALEYLRTSFLGDSVVLAELRSSMLEHRKALKAARHRYAEARLLVEERGSSLYDLRRALAEDDDDALEAILDATGARAIPGVSLVEDAFDMVGGFLGGDDDAKRREQAAALLEAEEEELIRAEREARDAETQHAAASSALQEATRDYVQAKRDARNHEVRIAELRVHVRDNILHYMQSIWASTPPDQRFLELHKVQVPVLDETVRVTSQGTSSEPGLGGLTAEQFDAAFESGAAGLEFRDLAEVADLDQLLGFKGNYALFPLRRGNSLTDLILAPMLDEHEVLRDPSDEAANWTLSDLEDYADALRADVREGRLTQQEFDDVHAPFLRATLERILTDPRPSEDVVIVPTDSLYAELLTSGGSLIEPFKKEHRALDVAQARAENRQAELDNLRIAARIKAGELADPDMDEFERHLVQGDGGPPP